MTHTTVAQHTTTVSADLKRIFNPANEAEYERTICDEAGLARRLRKRYTHTEDCEIWQDGAISAPLHELSLANMSRDPLPLYTALSVKLQVQWGETWSDEGSLLVGNRSVPETAAVSLLHCHVGSIGHRAACVQRFPRRVRPRMARTLHAETVRGTGWL